MKEETLRYRVLERGITSKAVARGLEAMHAARFLVKDHRKYRGGPWLRPTLPSGWRAEAEAVASCRSLLSINRIADEHLGGQLDRHLKNLRFEADSNMSSSEPRGARMVPKKRRTISGPPGCITRARQLNHNEYSYGSYKHRELKRGLKPSAVVAAEDLRRPHPRMSGR